MGRQGLLARGGLRRRECARTLRDLHAYLDGELDEATVWQVSRHLSRCEDCFDDAEQYRSIKEAVARLRLGSDPQVLAHLRTVAASIPDSDH